MGYSPSPIRRDSVISQAAQEICRYIEAERLTPRRGAAAGDPALANARYQPQLAARGAARAAWPRPCGERGGAARRCHRRRQGGKSVFDQSVLVEAAPVANDVRSHIAQKCAELPRSALPMPSWASLMQVWPSWKRRSPGRTSTRPRPRTNSFHALLLASARNPLLAAMFNQAQVGKAVQRSAAPKGFYDPRHLAHHRALLRALRGVMRAPRRQAVRRHYRKPGPDARGRRAARGGNQEEPDRE